jgi:hypothetical protein
MQLAGVSRVPDVKVSTRKPPTDWVVDVQDFCFVVSQEWVQDDEGVVINDSTWAMFLQQPNHARTPRLELHRTAQD